MTKKKKVHVRRLEASPTTTSFFKKLKIKATHHILRTCPISGHIAKKIKGGVF